MYKIIKKQELSPGVKLFDVLAPRIAKKALPGQFIILRVNEDGERIPLTIADFNREQGTITIIFQEVGVSTKLLGSLNEGEDILDFVGPLGTATHIEKIGTVVCIGGGIGVAPVYPIARAFKEAGNKVISIIGARSKDILILEDEMNAVSAELYITTDDGSKGQKGFVTDKLKELIGKKEEQQEGNDKKKIENLVFLIILSIFSMLIGKLISQLSTKVFSISIQIVFKLLFILLNKLKYNIIHVKSDSKSKALIQNLIFIWVPCDILYIR